MLSFRNNKKNTKNKDIFLAVDIGTEFVKTIVYRVNQKENVIEVVGYSKTRQDPSTMYAAFIVSLKEAIEKIDSSIGEAILMSKDILKDELFMPKKVSVGIAGELIQGALVEGKVIRDKPKTPVTKIEIDNIKNKLKETSFENFKQDISIDLGIDSDYIQEIDTYLNSCYVDGVRVVDPIGYICEELIYKIFVTFAPKIHISTLRQIFKNLNIDINKIIVEPYALSLSINNIRNKDSNAVIIDIGGGTTDVAIVEHGSIVGTKMFAVGGRVLSKTISTKLNTTYSEAEELKINYSKNQLDKYTKSKIAAISLNFVEIWLSGLEIIFEDFVDIFANNSFTFYLCGGGSLLPEIQAGLLEYPWTTRLNFTKQPRIDIVFPNQLSNIIDLTKLAITPMDVTVLSIARMHLENQ